MNFEHIDGNVNKRRRKQNQFSPNTCSACKHDSGIPVIDITERGRECQEVYKSFQKFFQRLSASGTVLISVYESPFRLLHLLIYTQGVPLGVMITERSHASDSIDEIHIENIPDGLETEEI